MRPPRDLPGIVCAVLILGSAGCVDHSAMARQTPAGPPVTALVDDRALPDLPVGIRTSYLPVDVAITTWRLDDDGALLRGDARVMTPLPWWQRFPLDVATDLAPVHLTCSAVVVFPLVPVPTTDEVALTSAAHGAGYARAPLSRVPSP